MADAEWDVREDATWYHVTARGTCPRCGAVFEERSQRRRVAGPPDTPPLEVREAADGMIELAAQGSFLPIALHRCEG